MTDTIFTLASITVERHIFNKMESAVWNSVFWAVWNGVARAAADTRQRVSLEDVQCLI